ncbi:hypothetical protein HOK51_03020 [Candidatus Woesearchaeota archaeon]|jgi:hypothetical protein|nr:hypothetical protein [Candidatus Woesearchaeota archaeon]MBT6518790.1 hypothetical protein [Candidatus Woesearchaeota archaeon]MBT7367929.1 hypothetical protein [Candidatus Woesearchaeota archaeon]
MSSNGPHFKTLEDHKNEVHEHLGAAVNAAAKGKYEVDRILLDESSTPDFYISKKITGIIAKFMQFRNKNDTPVEIYILSIGQVKMRVPTTESPNKPLYELIAATYTELHGHPVEIEEFDPAKF